MTKQVFKNNKFKITIKSLLISMILSLVFTSVSFAEGGGRYKTDEAWSFGVHGDTQWVNDDPAGENPNHVAVSLINILNQEFINRDVKFVIQVGDLTDRAGDAAMTTRAEASNLLYENHIGFFPMRGNHETAGSGYGLDDNLNLNIPAYLSSFPQTQGLYETDIYGNAKNFGATDFTSPMIYNADGDLVLDRQGNLPVLQGLSYSFDYGEDGTDARFVILDTMETDFSVVKAPVDDTYGQGYVYYGDWWFVFQATEQMEDTQQEGKYIEIGDFFWIHPTTGPTALYIPNPLSEAPPTQTAAPSRPYYPGEQQTWISERLDMSSRPEHAFVFSHKAPMGGLHVDSTFGSNPGSKADTQVPFFASMEDNGVKYFHAGHDHFHHRSVVESPEWTQEEEDGSITILSPEGQYAIQEIISAGASTKFYGPGSLESFNNTAYGDVKRREKVISEETYHVGYYIYTVDGPRVTVDYYSDLKGNFHTDYTQYPYGADNPDYPHNVTPKDLVFGKTETYGYSHNGQEFLIAQGESYTTIEDTYNKTTAKILSGENESESTDNTPSEIDDNGTPDDTSDDIILAPRPLIKTVNTGWVENPCGCKKHCNKHHKCKKNHHNKSCELKSDILSLYGMSEIGMSGLTEQYVLSMSFDFNKMKHFGIGETGIATFVDGKWVNAVDENYVKGKKKFIIGKYKSKYGLGTYGIDPKTKTAWAVLDYNADFAVAEDIEPPPKYKKFNKALNFIFRLFR